MPSLHLHRLAAVGASKYLYEGMVMIGAAPAEGWGGEKSKTWVAYRDEQGTLRKAHGEKRLEKDQWLLKGMTIQIAVDPRKPDRCELITDNVPLIGDLISANDPLVWDLAVVDAQITRLREEMAYTSRGLPFAATPVDVHAERQRESANWPSQPVVLADGRLRGTAAASVATPPPPRRRRWKGRRLVRVWPFGQAPYAFLEQHKFNMDEKYKRFDLGDVPCSINPSDRSDVVYLWEELDRSEEAIRRSYQEWYQREVGPR